MIFLTEVVLKFFLQLFFELGILFSRKRHHKASWFVLSAFWWVIKIGCSAICVFSVWSCHELKARFHPRLFCLCLNANVSFCLTSHCFFLELRPFCYTQFQEVWPCLCLNIVSDWDHVVQWWVNFKIFGTCLEKALQDMAASYVPYSLNRSFSFTFQFPIM